jgi:hypothetical protein
MRYLKSHQVPFNGFAWDHPLRARWREMERHDPIESVYQWWYALLEGLLALVMPPGAIITYFILVPTVVALACGHFKEAVFALPALSVFALLFILLARGWSWEPGRKFNWAMTDIARESAITIEQLAACDAQALHEVAMEALRQKAQKVKELREQLQHAAAAGGRNLNRAADAHKDAREKVTWAYYLFSKYGILPEKPKSEVDRVYKAIYD